VLRENISLPRCVIPQNKKSCYNDRKKSYLNVQNGLSMMKEQQMMKFSEVREHWSEVINLVSRDQMRVIVEKNGAPVAGLFSPGDLEWLKERDKRLAELRNVMDQMRDAFSDVSENEFNKEAERVLNEVRTERALSAAQGEA